MNQKVQGDPGSGGLPKTAPEARRDGSPGRKPWVSKNNDVSPGGAAHANAIRLLRMTDAKQLSSIRWSKNSLFPRCCVPERDKNSLLPQAGAQRSEAPIKNGYITSEIALALAPRASACAALANCQLLFAIYF